MTFQYCFDGSIKKVNNLSVSSPRTWGCFTTAPVRGLFNKSSPRTWGCFCLPKLCIGQEGVFPTHVGVFPCMLTEKEKRWRLPHARGGVSRTTGITFPMPESSPRTWGCFRILDVDGHGAGVFPTHVGVFPISRALMSKVVMVFPTHVGVFPLNRVVLLVAT